MSFRDRWRKLNRILRVFAVLDRGLNRPAADKVILFSCHDADRSVLRDNVRFAPLLEGIRTMTADLGYAGVNLTHPFALFSSCEIKDGSITVNYKSVGLRLLNSVERILPKTMRVGSAQRESAFYRSLLQSLQPRAIISIQPPFALCYAARQMRIPVVEAMHGTNYSMSDEVFAAHMSNRDEWLPNVLLSFDAVSHATMLARCKGRDITAMRTGDPWLHYLRLRDVDKQSNHTVTHTPSKKVLVSLQWGYDGDRDTLSGIVPNGIMHPVLEEVIATASDKFQFLVRLHPIQLNKPGYGHHRRYVKRLAAQHSNVEWERATTRPLPFVLDDVFAHVSMCSSSAGEAAAANVPSLLLCPTLLPGGANFGTFRELEASGHVTFGVLDATSVLDWLRARAVVPLKRPQYDVAQRHHEEIAFYEKLLRCTEPLRDSPQRHRQLRS